MKVFFQYINDTANLLGSGSGTATPLSLEELEFPEKIFNAVVSTLEERNGMLPIRTRIFREWKVGILNRFERGRNEK
ncbi:hypothetical protein PHISCL_08164 [Aspergillus sclerotialis]|uniref:Uncharacterized protein n=1 Tax=Aspergillus sclerotialis TaxID=2070753 RepID=A0A3A2Z8Q3_9EURO|nr:hypothetical protein PHISCL_08164 [Aspergillus sclerotialis]